MNTYDGLSRPDLRQGLPPEERLYEYIQSLDKHRKGRVGFLVSISGLEPKSHAPRHMKVVQNLLAKLDKKRSGQVFHLHGGDVIGLFLDLNVRDIDNLRVIFYETFSADPLVRSEITKAPEEQKFIRIFDVEKHYNVLLAYAKRRVDGVDGKALKPQAPQTLDDVFSTAVVKNLPPDVPPEPSEPVEDEQKGVLDNILTLARKLRKVTVRRSYEVGDLQKMTRNIETLDVADVAEYRRTYILGLDEVLPLFEEVSIPYSAIVGDLFETTSLGEMFWLNGYLHALLNKKIIHEIAGIERRDPALPISLRMPVRMARSDDFKSFLGFYSTEGKNLVVEFSIHDVLANPRWYVDARKTLHEHGAKCCMGDMDAFSFLGLDRTFLSADFEKIRPGKTFGVFEHAEFKNSLRQKIKELGEEKIIFTGCQTQEDVELGQSVGAHLFEGKFLDDMMGP